MFPPFSGSQFELCNVNIENFSYFVVIISYCCSVVLPNDYRANDRSKRVLFGILIQIDFRSGLKLRRDKSLGVNP